MSKYPNQFLKYIEIIIDNVEGGFVDHRDDPGGATNWGITQAVARKHNYNGDMRNLPREKAIDIYYQDYWNDKIMSSIRNHLAFHIFDCSINSGYSRAIKLLQRAIGVYEDGVIGVDTMNGISQYPEKEIIARFNIVRMHFYGTLKTFNTFGKGWRNRLLILSSIDWELEDEKY